MGMDVYGVKPKNEDGKYFRNNIWHWFPLLYLIESTGVLPDDLISAMQFNDGAGPNEEQAVELGNAMLEMIEGMDNSHFIMIDGTSMTEQMLQDLIKELEGSDSISDRMRGTTVSNVREFAKFSINSGGFEVC